MVKKQGNKSEIIMFKNTALVIVALSTLLISSSVLALRKIGSWQTTTIVNRHAMGELSIAGSHTVHTWLVTGTGAFMMPYVNLSR